MKEIKKIFDIPYLFDMIHLINVCMRMYVCGLVLGQIEKK